MGPNTTTGHLSVIYSVECQINFTLRLIRPILKSLHSPTASGPDSVAVKPEAEVNDNAWLQSKAKELVWATGCTSWYVDEKTGRNTMLYPDWQFKYWLRSVFIPKGDFVYRVVGKGEVRAQNRWGGWVLGGYLASVVGAGAVLLSEGKGEDVMSAIVGWGKALGWRA
jgi:hypothetical protein